jgi:hypothetical protein
MKKKKIIKIYYLYEDKGKEVRFIGRYASKHRTEAAARGLNLKSWFYETEEKEDKYHDE